MRLAPLEESLDAELTAVRRRSSRLPSVQDSPFHGCCTLGRARRRASRPATRPRARTRTRLVARPAPLAVRSSAVGEDSEEASFAGQHLTCLNVCSAVGVIEAVEAIWRSAHSDSALAYRRRLGVRGSPRIAVVVQELVDADCAGVLFTRNPLDGADELVVEAAWGLGEAVVAGLVTAGSLPGRPRRHRSRAGGRGEGSRRHARAHGGTEEVAISGERVRALCLDDASSGRWLGSPSGAAACSRAPATSSGHSRRGSPPASVQGGNARRLARVLTNRLLYPTGAGPHDLRRTPRGRWPTHFSVRVGRLLPRRRTPSVMRRSAQPSTSDPTFRCPM